MREAWRRLLTKRRKTEWMIEEWIQQKFWFILWFVIFLDDLSGHICNFYFWLVFISTIFFMNMQNKWNIEYINGFMQERCNSIADALQWRLSCTSPLIYELIIMHWESESKWPFTFANSFKQFSWKKVFVFQIKICIGLGHYQEGDRTNADEKQWIIAYINDLVQDCSNSIANALELLQSCTKPST